tara:strand:- start:71 stop:727 length:657 start_codon:yes stop_codon:yes gene_type:complete
MIKSFISAWKKAFDVKGKTSRKDFWLYQLATFIISLILSVFENLATNIQFALIQNEDVYEYPDFGLADIAAVVGQLLSIVYWLFLLGSIVVGISISIRRLRDIQKKWTWIFIQIIPILGSLYFMLYLMTRPSRNNLKSDDYIDKKSNKIKVKNTTLKNKKSSQKGTKSGLVDEDQIIDTKPNEEKSLKEKLADLKELFDQNLINEEEYNNLKGKLLDL